MSLKNNGTRFARASSWRNSLRSMRGRKYYVVLLVIAGLILLAFLFWPQAAVSNKSLGQCLSENGVQMYGSDSCSSCIKQKKLLGKDFEHIQYINCDFQGETCREKSITMYPIWTNGNQVLIGLQSLEDLANFGGCKL